jgi:hypothetical protein
MWIAGAGNGIYREARSSRWSGNGAWHKPGMKIAWRLTGDARHVKRWMPSGTNLALPLHFGLFLDRARWSETALESARKWREKICS